MGTAKKAGVILLLAMSALAGTAQAEIVTYRISGQVTDVNYVTDRQFDDDVFVGSDVWIDLAFESTRSAFLIDGNSAQWFFSTTQSSFQIASHGYEPVDLAGWNAFGFTNNSAGLNDVFTTSGEIIEKGEPGHYFIQINLGEDFIPEFGAFDTPPLTEQEIGPIISSSGFFLLGNESKGVNVAWEATSFTRLPTPGSLAGILLGSSLLCTRRRR